MLFSRLLFKLHIIHNLTIKRDRNGRAMVTIHRTDDKSSDIRPDVLRVPPTEENMKARYWRVAADPNKTNTLYLVNGVDPVKRVDLTEHDR